MGSGKSLVESLTEGVVRRDLAKEGASVLKKWEKTGLLEGLSSEHSRQGMACLLENQAKEILRESTSMSAGDVEGFAAVAFPLVRRVFAGLLAQDIVSVQPMSLPSGLIFFLDFTFSSDVDARRLGLEGGESLYGGGVVGSQITGGVSLSGDSLEDSFYNNNNGYASPTGTLALNHGATNGGLRLIAYGQCQVPDSQSPSGGRLDAITRFDPDLSGSWVAVFGMSGSTGLRQFNTANLVAISTTGTIGNGITLQRRLTQFNTGSVPKHDPSLAGFDVLLTFEDSDATAVSSFHAAGGLIRELTASGFAPGLAFPIVDRFTTGQSLGAVTATTTWGLEAETRIPEIDIKVDSIAVTAVTKKLKAKWTPELGQDLNAYHNLDAEVELTSILSEQIALEIDREILEDLIKGAAAGTYFWSRAPGLFLNRLTGKEVGASTAAPDFTGTVSAWYETLIETINDVSAQIHRKTLRGGANFVVTSPEVANILEFTAGFRASVTHDDEKGTIGAEKTGSLSKKFDVYVDPYFPRNVILVGRKGSSFLESGYVYAPYVPLQTTPTIFGTEDFVPRKGVMTRYSKKLVRPDMYGLVIVRGLTGESGS